MFTSDRDKKTAFIYLVISMAVAIFGGVYEHFSFGVWSAWMVYAFMIPLAGGAFPYLLRSMRKTSMAKSSQTAYAASCSIEGQSEERRLIDSRMLHHFAVAALTVGCILQGALAIYGTTNKLMAGYLAAGVLLLAASGICRITETRASRRPAGTEECFQ